MASAQAASPSKAAAGQPQSGFSIPKFSEPPRYKLLEKSFLSGIKVRRGNDWVPYDDVLLDPEEQPLINRLSGPFSGRGDAERAPIEIEFLGVPDDHMEPLNEAAEWMMEHVDELKELTRRKEGEGKRGRRRSRNPIDALTIIGPGAQVLKEAGESV